MNDKKILLVVNDVINEIIKRPQYINLDTNIVDIELDSLEFIKFIVAIENHFGFEFMDEDLIFGQYKVINDFVQLISKRVNNGTKNK